MLETAKKAALEAGKIIKENYGNVTVLKEKGGNWHEVVTKADLEAEEAVKRIIKEKFPGHNIISEETANPKTDSEYTWFIDPIDGTTNYVTQLNFSCVGIGLVKDGEVILGVVYNPIVDEMFWAEKGRGAFLNGNRIHVSDNDDLKRTVVNYCHQNNEEETRVIEKLFFRIKMGSRDFRRFGAAGLDLSYVACGRNDVFFHTNTRPTLWDFVPASIIAREAGARLTDWEGNEWGLESRNMLCTNGRLHDRMKEILKER